MIKKKSILKKNDSLIKNEIIAIEKVVAAVSPYSISVSEKIFGLITEELITFHKNKDKKNFKLCIDNSEILTNVITSYHSKILMINNYLVFDELGTLLLSTSIDPEAIDAVPISLSRKYSTLEKAQKYIKGDIKNLLYTYLTVRGYNDITTYIEFTYIKKLVSSPLALELLDTYDTYDV